MAHVLWNILLLWQNIIKFGYIMLTIINIHLKKSLSQLLDLLSIIILVRFKTNSVILIIF